MEPENYTEIKTLMGRREELMDLNKEIWYIIGNCEKSYLEIPLIEVYSQSSSFKIERVEENRQFVLKTIQGYQKIVEKEIDDINKKLDTL